MSKSKAAVHANDPPGVSAAMLVSASAVLSTMQHPTDGVLCEGWMLKKRRKKMQGYAKRYFMLSHQGVLSYSMEPGSPIRDSITMRLASITSSASDHSRAIHIDSASATFHLKALNLTDFALWLSSLRRFCTFAVNPNVDEPFMTPRGGRRSLSHSRSMTGSWNAGNSAPRALRAAQEISPTIKDLESIMTELSTAELGKKPKKQHKEKDKDKEKEHHNKDLFALLFHKKGHRSSSPPFSPSPSTSSYEPSQLSSPSPSTINPGTVFERLQLAVATLHAQHNALLNILETNVHAPSGTNSPLVRIREADFSANRRQSISTFESSSLWFDAEEGAEEFILTAEPTESDQQSDNSDDEDGTEVGGGAASDSSEDPALTTGQLTPTRSGRASNKNAKVVIRRMKLPAPMAGDDGSLLTVLRKNVGKDMSTISFPVSFNEPISILQRLAEDVEYTDLLAQAAASDDPVERMCLLASFAVSGYACTLYRASRKPFNPMLGETFEDVRMKFISEKVSHHPPIMASHASGEGWEYWGTSSPDSKFWGRSLEILTKGATNVKIGDSHYQWRKPSTFMRNLLVGEKYLAHEGELVVNELNSGHRCVLTFKEGGYWGPSRAVTGVVYGPSSSKALVRLDGNWNESIGLQLDAKGSHIRMLWRAHAFPPHAHDYYGFTGFTMSLNEITPDIADFLPPTDSRLRPDQRAMEDGNIELADEEKARLESAQRVRRKARDERGEKWEPKWFKADGEDWIYKGGYWESRSEKKWDGCEELW